MLNHAIRNTLIAGGLAAVGIWIGSGWRNACMMLAGTLISSASIFEWKRLARVLGAALDRNRIPKSAPAVVVFFVIRLTVYAGIIYGSLKCFQGSTVALLCGLGLAALAIGWEALRLLQH
jgi:small-conductance mechanosensitive channel